MNKPNVIVARNYSRPSLSGPAPAFTDHLLPGGEIVRVMSRELHERALAAAERKLAELSKHE